MKIAWLHSHLLLSLGAGKFVYEVVRRLVRSATVDVFVERASREHKDRYRAAGIKLREINTASSKSPWYWLAFPMYFSKDIRALSALRGRYDVFVSSFFPMNAAAHAAGLKPHLTYVFEPFAFFHDRDMIRGLPALKRLGCTVSGALYRNLDVQAVRAADSVLTINQGTARAVKNLYGRQARPTLLGVDTEAFSPRSSTRLEARWRGRKLVIHSTDFTPLKRTRSALEAIARLRVRCPEILLLITQSLSDRKGEESLDRDIERLGLHNHAERLGVIPEDELALVMSQAHVCMYTGVGQGAGAASLFVLECMACGVPAVRTRFTDEEVEDGVSGFLVEPLDPAGLDARLAELLADDAKRKRFGKAARQRIVDLYRWDPVARRIFTEIQSLAPRARGRAAGAKHTGS